MNTLAKRDFRFDNAKFFLIFLVVLGHMADAYCSYYSGMRCVFLYIYTFHMPAFLFISGLFSKHTVNKSYLDWKRLLPYPILGVLLNFFRNFSLYLFDHEKTFHIMKQDSVSWFLWVLFVFYILTYLLKSFPKKNVLILSLVFALLAGYDTQIGTQFALSRILVFYPFFYLGYAFKRKNLNRILDNKALKVTSFFWLIAYGVILFLTIDIGAYRMRKFFTGQNSYKTIFGENFFADWHLFAAAPVFRLITMLLTFATMIAFLALVPKRRLFAISTAGRRTLAVYFWHLPIVTVIINVGVLHFFAIASLKNCFFFSLGVAVLLTLLLSLPCFSIPLDWIIHPGQRKAAKKNIKEEKKLVSDLQHQQQEIRQREQLHRPEPIAEVAVEASSFDAKSGITVNQIITDSLLQNLRAGGSAADLAFANILTAKRIHINRLQKEDPLRANKELEILKSGVSKFVEQSAVQNEAQPINLHAAEESLDEVLSKLEEPHK